VSWGRRNDVFHTKIFFPLANVGCRGGIVMGKIETLQDIFIKLNITEDALIRLSDKEWMKKVQLPNRTIRFLEQTMPNAFFCFDNKPMILFFENPKNKKKLHKHIWNFNETPIVIILENGSIEIFNGFRVNELGDDKGFLVKIGNQEKLNDFTYFKLVTGKVWEIYQNELAYANRVDYRLLTNIKDARLLILNKFPETENEETQKIYSKITNALLGKLIFVRYLIDRRVILNFNNQPKIWTNDDFCKLLRNTKKTQDFFNYLADKETGFNGDLFSIEKKEYGIIPNEAYSILINLLQSQDIGTGQLSLFDLYDFSVIPIEFISNVYESFLGIEKKEKIIKEEKENKEKKDDGVHYTPLFLVDYILSETVEKRLAEINDTNCKVLDPACGSGVFLVETLRKLLERYKEKNMKIYENNKEQFKKDIKNIVKENIYGIDKDASAVQVAIFSIYLTLLDYLNPPEIRTFKFPELLNTNFFCDDFFNEKADFNDKLKEKDFSFIIGNPPWMRGRNEKNTPLYLTYIKNRKENEKENLKSKKPIINIGNKEIAQAFLLRTSDFSTVNTKCSLIVTSKVLYNLKSKDFREYFLYNYLIERVFELAPVRREVFNKSNDKAIAPACVLFFYYANSQDTDNNLIEHITLKPSRFFSMFNIFTINHHDIKTVQQNRLKKYDWLWKVLVYGSYLDFNFINRLKNDYLTIQKYIYNNGSFIVGQGIMVGDEEIYDATELIGKTYINTRTDIQKFWISPNAKKWQIPIVDRIRNMELFKAPILLIKKGFQNNFSMVSAISYYDAVFTDSLTALKTTKKNIYLLRNIAGVIASAVTTYLNLMTFSSSGIEREQSFGEEKLDIPFFEDDNIFNAVNNIVNDIEKLLIQKFQTPLEDNNIQYMIDNKYNELNNSLYHAFSITKEEECLLDYAINIIIPTQMQHKNYEKLFQPIQLNDTILTDYANLFIERFKSSFVSVGKKFVIEIWHTQQIIGMFFKVIPSNEYSKDIILKDKQDDVSGVLQTIVALSSKEITDKLFIQKNIRGFEKDCFYIFKPNERHLWHKAVGYFDVYEFLDAILITGKNKK
jgi:hypothetical protein